MGILNIHIYFLWPAHIFLNGKCHINSWNPGFSFDCIRSGYPQYTFLLGSSKLELRREAVAFR